MDNLEIWVWVLVLLCIYYLGWLVVAVIIDLYRVLDRYLEKKERK